MANFYEVGGAIRDQILGRPSKDIDFAVEAESFDAMVVAVEALGYTVKVKQPQFYRLLAVGPKGACDFVLCRREGTYSDGRHPDRVEPGTIYEDLARRDFTVNAIARREDGSLVDPFGGVKDCHWGLLRCVGNSAERFTEDGLRMLRALRFAVTRSLILDGAIIDLLRDRSFFEPRMKGVSAERVREELTKMFSCTTIGTLDLFDHFPEMRAFLFRNTVIWLKPTMEAR